MTQQEANQITQFIQGLVGGGTVTTDPTPAVEDNQEPGIDWTTLAGERMGKCPVDGEDAWHNTGTSTKNGKPYENLKCTKNEKHIYWRELRD